ncbi:hypothetical protein C8R43DRAFT_1018719 [Mycena crocata]|nr:hypothetical protein C8R43DRAFT_1018719 [Mycena crocata]
MLLILVCSTLLATDYSPLNRTAPPRVPSTFPSTHTPRFPPVNFRYSRCSAQKSVYASHSSRARLAAANSRVLPLVCGWGVRPRPHSASGSPSPSRTRTNAQSVPERSDPLFADPVRSCFGSSRDCILPQSACAFPPRIHASLLPLARCRPLQSAVGSPHHAHARARNAESSRSDESHKPRHHAQRMHATYAVAAGLLHPSPPRFPAPSLAQARTAEGEGESVPCLSKADHSIRYQCKSPVVSCRARRGWVGGGRRRDVIHVQSMRRRVEPR